MSKSILHLDLHLYAKNSVKMREALDDFMADAARKRVKKAEIIPGKGTGQLMNATKRYLEQPGVKQQYKWYHVDPKNHGRLFVYFH